MEADCPRTKNSGAGASADSRGQPLSTRRSPSADSIRAPDTISFCRRPSRARIIWSRSNSQTALVTEDSIVCPSEARSSPTDRLMPTYWIPSCTATMATVASRYQGSMKRSRRLDRVDCVFNRTTRTSAPPPFRIDRRRLRRQQGVVQPDDPALAAAQVLDHRGVISLEQLAQGVIGQGRIESPLDLGGQLRILVVHPEIDGIREEQRPGLFDGQLGVGILPGVQFDRRFADSSRQRIETMRRQHAEQAFIIGRGQYRV